MVTLSDKVISLEIDVDRRDELDVMFELLDRPAEDLFKLFPPGDIGYDRKREILKGWKRVFEEARL